MKKYTKIVLLSLIISLLCAQTSFAEEKVGFIKSKWRKFLATFKNEEKLTKEEMRMQTERIEHGLKAEGASGEIQKLPQDYTPVRPEILRPPPSPPKVPAPPPSPPSEPPRR